MQSSYSILLLSNDTEVCGKIISLLDKYEVIQQQFNLAKLTAYVDKLNPVAIIVDLDDYEYYIYKSIIMAERDNYIPVLAIHSKDRSIMSNTDAAMEYYMHKSDIGTNITGLIKIFADFRFKYTDIKQSYTISDLINSQTDSLLKKLIGNELRHCDSIEHLIRCVFMNNIQDVNKPRHILIAGMVDDEADLDIYDLGGGTMVKYSESIDSSDFEKLFNIGKELENAFYTNFPNQDCPELKSFKGVFSFKMEDSLKSIRNITGYITTDTAIFGLNYDEDVSLFDAGIVKELCINYNLIQNIYKQMNKVNSAFIYTVNALSRASEVNDDDTGMHIKRVNAYSRLIAENLGLGSKYSDTIAFSAQMHDVGKLSVPKEILTKPSKLTADEFSIMKSHTLLGARIIGDSPQLAMASEIAISHHEKFDGSGYPFNKAGEEIPLSGRIVAMADIYDALRTERVYKPAYEHKKAFDIITKGDGRVMPQHFDPQILEIFKLRHKEFCDIYEDIK